MFLDDEFLLTTKTAKTLFDACKDLPIIDYHCHLHPAEIEADSNLPGIIAAWLGGRTVDGGYYGDHYKWRLMRANGVPEQLITGDGDDWSKFQAFAVTMEKAVGSPVSLWTNLELRRIFGINETLTSANARAIFDRANELLATSGFSTRNLIRRSNVQTVCTTDDPLDHLNAHKALATETSFKVVPAFRPDMALKPADEAFAGWLGRLEGESGIVISRFADLVQALASRVKYFHTAGARLSDQSLEAFRFKTADQQQLDQILEVARTDGSQLDDDQVAQFRTAMLLELLRVYNDFGWTAQLHLHASRNVNTAMARAYGPDTGFDSISDVDCAYDLALLLDTASGQDELPRLIVYSVNPNNWAAIASILGCFQGGIEQRLALGNAWWFNDTRSGIRSQLTNMAEYSLLGNFVGMTTDSRSFLSYPRHEFFRRVLCELVGEWADRGEITDDMDQLTTLVCNISYWNAKKYFAL